MGRETPCHVRGLSPVTRSTATIAGTQQTSRSSCCPAIPAAWCSIVGLNGERSPSGHTGHAPNRQVDTSLPSPSSSQGTDDSAGDTAHRDSQILMHGYKRIPHPRQDVLSSSLQLASGYEHLWFPQEQTWCLNYSLVLSLRGQWQ